MKLKYGVWYHDGSNCPQCGKNTLQHMKVNKKGYLRFRCTSCGFGDK